MFSVYESKRQNLLTKASLPSVFEVIGNNGIYATLHSREDAELVAYGLNHGYPEHFLGGFSDAVAEEIRAEMANTGERKCQR